MPHSRDTMVDRPETDGAAYLTGWTISGAAVLGTVLAVWLLDLAALKLVTRGSTFERSRHTGDTRQIGSSRKPAMAARWSKRQSALWIRV